jgi:hypothetical protein
LIQHHFAQGIGCAVSSCQDSHGEVAVAA